MPADDKEFMEKRYWMKTYNILPAPRAYNKFSIGQRKLGLWMLLVLLDVACDL